MAKQFIFIGDPGLNAPVMLKTLNDAGLTPKRMAPSSGMVADLAADPPAAVMVSGGIDGVPELVTSLREEQALMSVPVLVCVSALDTEYLNEAFRCGVDDYYVDGSPAQFDALVATLLREDSWRAVRAPAGQVILAHDDRLERVKLGRVLKRNGFDTFFAASTAELDAALQRIDARAVIADSELPGDSLVDLLNESRAREKKTTPWIVVTPPEKAEELGAVLLQRAKTDLFEAGADAEGLTFVMNELLAPPPVGIRRSPRILYGTPASFVHSGGKVPFFGFTYNVNVGGLYIRTLTPLPLQTQIEVTFAPPFGRGQVVASAQVVWRKGIGDTGGAAAPPGMGIQFLDLWEADKAGFEAGYLLLLEETKGKIRPSIDSPPEV